MIRYTIGWLLHGHGVRFGDTFTVKASRRDRKKFLKETRQIYANRGHRMITPTQLPSERPDPQPPVADKPPRMPPGHDPRAGRPIPSLYYTPSLWDAVKRGFKV